MSSHAGGTQENTSADSSNVEAKFVHVSTFLPLKSWKHLIPFQLLTLRVLRQAKESPDLVNNSVKADLPKKHFWTLSIWRDKESMMRFVMSEPHATATEKFRVWAGEGAAFVEWTSSSSSIDWADALERLKNPTFYYSKEK